MSAMKTRAMENAEAFFAMLVVVPVLTGWPVFLSVVSVTLVADLFMRSRSMTAPRPLWRAAVFSSFVSLLATDLVWRFWPIATFHGPMWAYAPVPLFGPAVVALVPIIITMAAFFELRRRKAQQGAPAELPPSASVR